MEPLNPDEAAAKLRVAHHRLKTALDRFYTQNLSGDPVALEAAALDIATPIRVMVHHVPEKQTVALLHQVNTDFLNMPIHFKPLISAPPQTLASGVQTMSITIPLNLTLRAAGTSFTRYVGTGGTNFNAPLRNWWFEPCWDSGNNRVSNKDIILAIANKEGGAHVDGDMSAKYKAAKNQGRIVVSGRPVSDVVRLGSLVGIAGDELLEYLSSHFGVG